ncbi:alpha-L-fucosidase [Parabacteroides goldsteinii]|uniref:alpha-L-fucosidase n=1 Tax=Parabacteroides goldsteinii TaxID=328812 RepID=UPI00256F2282|nr:alpha-L-fucosidase [Parabacteroides goldsteinii]
MKKIYSFLLGTMLLTACSQTQEGGMPFQNTIKIEEGDSQELIIEKAAHVVPTPNQLAALQNEFIAFIHFGPNTFTRMEWGNGMEDPKVFDLKELDTDQWCEAMKAAGMKMVIITVKHHDGFVLWQSRYTKHGIMSSNFRDGKGDVLKDLSASCQKYGLKLGVYLSPADLFQIESPDGLYGNLSEYTKRTIPREVPGRPFANQTKFEFVVDDYNEYFLNQLFEILTEYGPIHEVWFDGAHPKRKGGQTYNYPAWKELIHKLAPNAVIFGREDVRWCGNEAGGTRPTEWNVITYQADPDTMTQFADMTDPVLGDREKLYQAKYLHYQQAETNTSIREGWFYRDDTRQKVRSTDDVFDIYERAVGGNSTFLLNIPPNRDGKFSPADVAVLQETGKRIMETYGTDLLAGAKGPEEVLDGKDDTYLLLKGSKKEFVVKMPSPVTLNRIMLQEAVATNGERVEKHAVDAWIDGAWKEIVVSTNIGYKRILRFPEVTTDKLRFRLLESRLTPAISHISAHYYKSRPPQLSFVQDVNGLVTIEPKLQDFGWNPHGQNAAGNLNAGYKIYYTTDGKEPDETASEYKEPVKMDRGELKAVAILKGEKGAVHSERLGLTKKDWKLVGKSSETDRNPATAAFDAKSRTYWRSQEGKCPFYIAIDLGAAQTLNGFAYTPQIRNSEGMMAKGVIKVSDDGKNWKEAERFEFGNLINDPTKRYHYFKNPVTARYVRIEATEIAANGKVVTIAELDLL